MYEEVRDHVSQLGHMLMGTQPRRQHREDRFCPNAQITERQIAGGEEFSTAPGKLIHLKRGEREITGKDRVGSSLWNEGGELGQTDVIVRSCMWISTRGVQSTGGEYSLLILYAGRHLTS